ncbi:MAG: phosphopentomutase [Sinobacteraceae bacterium]|nr:phosphopentomutase [Nevskiaceae bacterium]
MPRAIIAVLDSLGVGSAPDAAQFGDAGACTLGHIAAKCAAGAADIAGVRQGPLRIPNLTRLGLARTTHAASGLSAGLDLQSEPQAAYGYAAEVSHGKDTPSGHWEMVGLPVEFDWGYFPPEVPCFPRLLIDKLIERARLPGVLGERHASGTDIIRELGEEHVRTGKPIVYTSADSVFQIAAHEKYFGLERLYETSQIAHELVREYRICRVIARPFVGERSADFKRTTNRRDYTTRPHAPTLLSLWSGRGRPVISIGKVADIFAQDGITTTVKAGGNDEIFEALLRQLEQAPDEAIIFANFVDFDTLYGHRRDVPGYARALEELDRRLPEVESRLRTSDLAVLTADHGCDPTWRGTDHTREFIPVLAFGPTVAPGFFGARRSFADIGQSIAAHLGLEPLPFGASFLKSA